MHTDRMYLLQVFSILVLLFSCTCYAYIAQDEEAEQGDMQYAEKNDVDDGKENIMSWEQESEKQDEDGEFQKVSEDMDAKAEDLDGDSSEEQYAAESDAVEYIQNSLAKEMDDYQLEDKLAEEQQDEEDGENEESPAEDQQGGDDDYLLEDEVGDFVKEQDHYEFAGEEYDEANKAGEVSPLDAENQQADRLSLVTRYVGVPYNLIRGSPEGDFNSGGIDPGIKITRHIFRFTYNQRKMSHYLGRGMNVPDQVIFHASSSCAASEVKTAYSGTKSYQKALSTSVSVSGSYGFYSFSASAAFSQARAGTESQRKVTMDKKKICNYGRARYFGGNTPQMKITDEFYRAVKRLPVQYNEGAYFAFIENWGTHIIFEADLGTKEIERSQSSYASAYSFLQTQTSFSGGVSYNSLATSGSVGIDISTLDQRVSASSTFGSRKTKFTIGTRNVPLPIKMKLNQIFVALDTDYWTHLPSGASYASLQITQKRNNLIRAFNRYQYRRGVLATDPNLMIKVTWPAGRYALVKSRYGCPEGFSASGCRYQDTEDNNNRNSFSGTSWLTGQFNRNIKMCYCIKSSSVPSAFSWPRGRYCIARYGGSCPDGFHGGSIYWDDEDRRNANRRDTTLPDGNYGRDTLVQYCCRDDGNINTPMLLPPTKCFALYQYQGAGCQRIHGMRSKEVRVHFDDEDRNNRNRCDRAHPFDPGCHNRNHQIRMCYYLR